MWATLYILVNKLRLIYEKATISIICSSHPSPI